MAPSDRSVAGSLAAFNLGKRFGTLAALKGVSVEFLPGEVHAVVGENGAGKSTLMNLLAGFLIPDEGEIFLDGTRIPGGRPDLARKRGIEMVHQHFTLVPELTVAENLALSQIKSLGARVDLDEMAGPALRIGRDLGWDLSADSKVRTLPVGVQQRIEILKCLSGNACALILDEPTAVLAPSEVTDLLTVIRRLAGEGKIIVLIAHKLDEVLAAADRVTVLRHGEWVATARRDEVDAHRLAHWMVGDMPVEEVKRASMAAADGLRLKHVSVLGDRKNEAVRCVSLHVCRGEILGIGGVDGNGQIELAEAMAQVRAAASGEMLWQGSRAAEAPMQIAYIPQDRQLDGLAMSMSVLDNLLIQGIDRPEIVRAGVISKSGAMSWARKLVERFDVKVDSLAAPVSELSGGNQQKIVVSRNLDLTPDLLVAVNPTRGLDIKGAKFVQDQIRSARAAGVAVALFSTDLDELAVLADRTVFLSRGELIEGSDALALLGARP